MHCQFSRPDCPQSRPLILVSHSTISRARRSLIKKTVLPLPSRSHRTVSKLHILTHPYRLQSRIFSLLLRFRSTFRTFTSSRSLTFTRTRISVFLFASLYRFLPVSLFLFAIIPPSSSSPSLPPPHPARKAHSPIRSASLFLVYVLPSYSLHAIQGRMNLCPSLASHQRYWHKKSTRFLLSCARHMIISLCEAFTNAYTSCRAICIRNHARAVAYSLLVLIGNDRH